MEKKETQGLTVKKKDNISEWYTQVIQKADLADYTQVSGCIVFKPNSYEIWERIKYEVDKRLKDMGIKNSYFPLLIPESLLKKEEDHVKGFSPEVAWVTHGGDKKLNERLAIRPTSETIMYDSYSKWIRSWRDLPLRLNQWNSVVRWEFKHAIPFLRTREFLWNEGHTAFATKEEAEQEMKDILKLWQLICNDYLALPSLAGQKTEKEKFAGAEHTWTLEFYLPSGKAAQGPDAHFDGQKFAKAFDIKFLDKDNKAQYVYQNTWAITTRMLGILVMIHGDDKGLILPPRIAPTQIVIVPIITKKDKENVLKKALEIKKGLGKDFRVELDDREIYSPGWKFNEWELKGIPIRIEIGPRDLEKDQVVVVRRDLNTKKVIKQIHIKKEIEALLDTIQRSLFTKAKNLLQENIVEVTAWKEFERVIKDKKIAKAHFCNVTSCEDNIKAKLEGAKSLNIPFEQEGNLKNCAHCGKKAKVVAYFAKSY